MKKLAIAVVVMCTLTAVASFAAANETYLRFKIDSRDELSKLTRIMSIDNIKDGYVYAYACNEAEMEAFKSMGYAYEVLPRPSTVQEVAMADTKADLKAWDVYPTYQAYVDMMYQFETDYPDLCDVFSIGQTVEGREILFAKISDNVGIEEDEPEVLHTSTMHGDEVTGYVLCLRLIDSILSTYATDSRIANMVNEMEIYINPDANPDGTYAGGNSSVSGATRSNANGVDLNRNYKDPQDGDHPDGNAWQVENIHQMDFMADHSIVISTNIHGGAELANYPWDTWSKRHADDTWWIAICRSFVDTIHVYGPSGYMTDENNGITHGYDWYEVDGGRQDYMTYFRRGREMTLEISPKMPSASALPGYWNYDHRSLMLWLERALYGIRGVVTNSATGDPLAATITIPGFDSLNSAVWTDPEVGNYHRMIQPGTYTLVFSAPGFYPDTVAGVTVSSYTSTVRVDVALDELPNTPVLVYESYEASGSNPGTEVDMSITVSNMGLGNASGVTGVLATADEFITITQNTSAFPTLQAETGLGTSLTDYEFTVSDTCPLFHMVSFKLHLTDDEDYADSVTFEFMVGDRVVFYFDDFSTNQGWTGLGSTGEWTIGECIGGGTTYKDPTADHSSSSDDRVLGNDLTSVGTYNNNMSTTDWAYSPTIDCSDRTGVQLSFWRWLGCESSTYDHADFAVFDGDTWVNLYSNTSSSQETSWNEAIYDLSAYADNNPGFRMRWGIGPTDGSAQYSGWNIDDIELKGYGGSGGDPIMVLTPTTLVDSLQPGDQKQAMLKIKNEGDASLGVWFTTTDTWLSFSAEKQTVPVADSLVFPVVIDATTLAGGDHVGAVNFTSNDENNASGSVPVALHVFIPELMLTQSKIEETVGPDESKVVPLVIENTGPGRLIYQAGATMDAKRHTTVPQQTMQPLGYRLTDPDKTPDLQEPYFDAATKGSGGPDTFGYQWKDSDEPGGPVFDWIDISSVGAEVAGLDDDNSVAITIGFGFPMYDSTYSSLYVCSNGYITFDTGYGSATNYAVPTASYQSAMIALWQDDLDPPEAGHVYYYHDAANGRFIVSFNNIRNYLYPTGTGDLSFQAIMYADGRIVLQYGTMDPGTDTDGLLSATIGIQNSTSDDGLQVVYNAAYMHDNLAIELSAATWLSLNKSGAAVEPHALDTIMVTLDATELVEGDYTGSIILTCNDPVTPSQTIDVILTVSEGCCVGPIVGNVDGSADNAVTMGDLTVLIDHLFVSYEPIACIDEGDVDLSGAPDPQADDINMGDLTVLIDHLFISYDPLPACP